MQQSHEPTTKQKIVEAISNTVYSLRYILLGLLGALVVFVIVFLTASEIRQRRIERSTIIVERIENDFDTWMEQEISETSQAMNTELLERIADLLDQYPKLYAAQRALHIRGRMYYRSAMWDEARASFVEIADRFPRSYLAPVSLVDAATAMEEADRVDDAIVLLQRAIDEFDTPETPAILFSLGRLSEEVNGEAAIVYYEQLLDEYPSSGWTNLAQSRIISLKIDRS